MSDKREFLNGLVAGSAATALVAAAVAWFKSRPASVAASDNADISTTSSSHSGNVYETSKAVAEYLMFHFGSSKDLLPYPEGPHNALDFAARTAVICADWCKKVGIPLEAALDVGCAVGGSSYEFSREFGRVVGIDYSHAFVAAANSLKAAGKAEYTMTVEGGITSTHTAVVPSGVHSDRITFRQGDACDLPRDMGRFSVIHGANLLCRLPNPMSFLERLPSLLLPGGLVVFISPYSWLKQYTEKDKWLGGVVDGKSGAPQWSKDGLGAAMTGLGFTLLHDENCPFLIREHARKFQWGCSHVTVWQLKA